MKKQLLELGFAAIAALLSIAVSTAKAVPIAGLDWVETEQAGCWRYDFTLTNLSDPAADAGIDLYDLWLFFDPTLAPTDFNAPGSWFADGGNGFFLAFADFGVEILPGESLAGFGFTLDGRLLDGISFSTHLTNPSGGDPYEYSNALTPIPEPGTAILLGIGGLALAAFRRRLSR